MGLLALWDPFTVSIELSRSHFLFYGYSMKRNKLTRPPLNDDTRQYGKFRELAKKLVTVPKKAGDKKLEEVKEGQQKKGAAE